MKTIQICSPSAHCLLICNTRLSITQGRVPGRPQTDSVLGLEQAPEPLINEMCIMTRFVTLLGWSRQHCQHEICNCAGMRSRRSPRRLWWPRRRLALQQSWLTRRPQEHRSVSHILIICAAQLSLAPYAAQEIMWQFFHYAPVPWGSVSSGDKLQATHVSCEWGRAGRQGGCSSTGQSCML